MDGRMHNLHCRYRMIGGATAASLAHRLDRVAHGSVVDACAEALDQALGDDRAVYVLRRVQSRFGLLVTPDTSDAQLAWRWGQCLAQAIVHSIGRDADDGGLVMRFDNQAEYVARFICDLVRGEAWNRWFYHPFQALQSLDARAALCAVLDDHRADTPAILAHLHQQGSLGRVLLLLGEDRTRALWHEDVRGVVVPNTSALRPLFAAAFRLATELGFVTFASEQAEAWLLAYLPHAPSPIDWRDRRGLSAAVFDALHWLLQQESAIRASKLGHSLDRNARVAQVLAGLDWLDGTWLEQELSELLARMKEESGVRSQESILNTRLPERVEPEMLVRPPVYAPTARQRQLLADLATVIEACQLPIEVEHAASPTNALHLYAALIAHAPHWDGDPLASGVIAQLLAAWAGSGSAITNSAHDTHPPMPVAAAASVTSNGARTAGRTFLAQFGDAAAALLELLQERARPESASKMRTVATTTRTLPNQGGQAGLAEHEAVARLRQVQADNQARGLIQDAPDPAPANGHATGRMPQVIETGCAGVLLLLRALLDTQLPALLARTFDGDQALVNAYLVALGMRWAGQVGVIDGMPDPALVVMTGSDQPPGHLEALRNTLYGCRTDPHTQIQAGMLRTLAGQRVLRGAEMYLYDLPVGREHALVAGDETAGPWAFGAISDAPNQAQALVSGWLAHWREATGRDPQIIDDASILSDDEGAETIQHHQLRRAALAGALQALDAAALGDRNTDLAVALTAISLLHVWARWLRQFSGSSTPYLLEQFVRRPGRVLLSPNTIMVELERGPLDVVLQMSGYMAEIEHVPWLGRRRIQYRFL